MLCVVQSTMLHGEFFRINELVVGMKSSGERLMPPKREARQLCLVHKMSKSDLRSTLALRPSIELASHPQSCQPAAAFRFYFKTTTTTEYISACANATQRRLSKPVWTAAGSIELPKQRFSFCKSCMKF